jgi:hypothetical protein
MKSYDTPAAQTTRKTLRCLMCATLLLGLVPAAASATTTLNNSEEPGSALVFHKFIRGTGNDAGVSGQPVHANSEFEISAVCPRGTSCLQNAIVRLRAHWVCPGCTATSFGLETTVGGTVYFNPEGVTVVGGVVTSDVFPSNATTTIPQPACNRGYLIVWAIDATGKAIKFDGLIGDAVIRAPTPGFGPTSASAYNAVPIQAAASLPAGARTDVDFDGSLDFNGAEYKALSGNIYGTVRYENTVPPEGVVETALTLLTLDVVSNFANPVTRVGLNFYTANEELVDTATSFACWTEVALTDILPSLTTQIMGRKGLVESTYAEQQLDLFTTKPVTFLGIVDTQERYVATGLATPGRSYSYSLYHDKKPVPTTFKP